MINDLFINLLLLVSFTFIAGSILRDIPNNIINSVLGKIVLGISGGLMGTLLMIYTIEIEGTTTLLDLRNFAIMMTSYIGGFIPTIVSGLIIGIYRTLHFGLSISSITASFQILLYIICFHIIDKKIKLNWMKWLSKTLISLVIILLSISYLLRNIENFQIILLQFSLVILLASIVEYSLLDYIKNSNELYRAYKKDSTKDFLTGLYNTRYFDKMLNSAFERVLKNNENLSCLMIDIDYFKKINDTYGHAIGDVVLKELAAILKDSCNASNILGRIGGEEFCVIIFNTSKNETFKIASRINNKVQNHNFYISENKFINITVSIGIAVYPETTTNLEDIKKKADMSLYHAKHSGRNKVCDSEMCIIT